MPRVVPSGVSYQRLPSGPERIDADDLEPDGDGNNTTTTPSERPPQLVDARVKWIHFILGCSILLPWNAIITSIPFFLTRLEDSPHKAMFSSYLSASFTLANFGFLIHATATVKTTRPSRQIRLSIICGTFLTLLLTLSTYFTLSPGYFFSFVLINGIIQAAAGSYFQTSAIAVASLFGPPAVQAMMAGQGAVAVAVSAVQVMSSMASTWKEPQTYVSDGSAEEHSAFIFFGISTLFLCGSTGAHAWLISMPSYQSVAATLEQTTKLVGYEPPEEASNLVSRGCDEVSSEKGSLLRVAKANIGYEIAVAYVFVVTLAVFPSVTTSVVPNNPNTHPLLFSAIHFLVFNSGDFLGRYVCSFPVLLIWSSNRLLLMSIARTLFVPLFLMCNIQRSTTTMSTPPIINSDVLYMFLLLAFGLTNGYISSLCMMSAPSLEHNQGLRGRAEDVDVAATVASLCLVGGLAIGSVGSFLLKAAVCECNPFTS